MKMEHQLLCGMVMFRGQFRHKCPHRISLQLGLLDLSGFNELVVKRKREQRVWQLSEVILEDGCDTAKVIEFIGVSQVERIVFASLEQRGDDLAKSCTSSLTIDSFIFQTCRRSARCACTSQEERTKKIDGVDAFFYNHWNISLTILRIRAGLLREVTTKHGRSCHRPMSTTRITVHIRSTDLKENAHEAAEAAVSRQAVSIEGADGGCSGYVLQCYSLRRPMSEVAKEIQ